MSTVAAPPQSNRPDTRAVIGAVTRRSLVRVRRMPSAFIPSLAMPVFQVIAFGGTFGAAVVIAFAQFQRQEIDALDWYVPLAAIQGASFGALGVSFGLIQDLQNGFFDRLRMSPAGRTALLLGPLVAALVRAVIPVTLVILIGLLGGMNTPGGVLGILCVYVAALGVAFAATGFALGLTFRMRNMAAATLTQFAIFFVIFLSTSQMPIFAIEGWLHGVARVNPMTNVLRLGREGLLGEVTWANTWPGLLALAIMGALGVVYAIRGLRTFDDR